MHYQQLQGQSLHAAFAPVSHKVWRQDVVEIMQKHGADLTGRPRHIAAGDIHSGGMRTLLVDAGETLRKLRKCELLS